MVSPMREKRVWPPQDKDSDGETVAAFEAAVAVVKETVVRSGEVLVSAKEDLSDHQRWLKVQTAAVQADRERHDRWLHRQREREEAFERREQKRTRRRAMRQAAVRSIKDAVSAASLAVRSVLWLVVAKIVSGLNYIDGLAAKVVWGGLLIAGRTARPLARSIWILLSAGVSRIAAKVHALAPSLGNFLSLCFGRLAARAHDISRSIGRGSATGFSWLSAKADPLTRSAGEALAPALSGVSARAYALAPSFWDKVARAGLGARHCPKEGTARVQSLLPTAEAPRVDAENAVSLPQRVGGIDLSQMLIIAGALLLVCGGLMLGGGLILRASTPSSSLAAATPAEPIAWLFEHKNFPIDERSVFDFAVTPEGVRIKGFSIGGVNMSDEPLGSVGGVIKPDLHGQELKLAVIVGQPGDDAVGAQPSEAAAAEALADSIPPQAPFKLVFVFPGAADAGGMTPEEVLRASGGLTLKVHYEVAGKHKSFIQYLPPLLLEDQLNEIQAGAKGS